jgi:reactive intermediate/imine deaminase
MSRKPVHTDKAPEAIGPYSQAIHAGDTVYLSGQIPLDPETGSLIRGEIETQARRVFENLRAVCEAAGGSLGDIVKLNIYLTDLSHFGTINEIMQQYFNEPYPARAAIGVAELPRGAEVEMDGVMVLGD